MPTRFKKPQASELKSCPFCGGNAVLVNDVQEDKTVHYEYKVAYVECTTCLCRTRKFVTDGYFGATTTAQDAITTWNRRTR